MEPTALLAQHALALRFEDLPAAARERARWCFFDWLGCTLGGSREPLARILGATCAELGGAPQASVLGRSLRTSVTQAAMINGAASHALDYDDVHPPLIGHPAVAVIPAAFAVAEWRGASGTELLAAVVAGYDVMGRLGQAVEPQHYDDGWHATGTLGHFGAAAAAGRLLGLDLPQMMTALGLAGTQAAGVRQAFGTMAKPLHAGKAAGNGVLAALLAMRGFSGPPAIVEGHQGFTAVTCRRFDPQQLQERLAGPPVVLEAAFKRHAACGATHSTIDAVLAMREQGLTPDRLQELHLAIYPLAMDAAGKLDPRTGLEAKFSVPFCAALALVHGAAGEDLYTDAMAVDPEVRSVMRRIRIDLDPSMKYVEAMPVIATARTTDGREYVEHVELPKGRPSNPFSAADYTGKFTRLARAALAPDAITRAIELCGRLEALDDIEALVAATTTRDD